MLTIQKILLLQLAILLTFTSCSDSSEFDLDLDDFLSPTSEQVFKYKVSTRNSSKRSGTTNMPDKFIEKVGSGVKKNCLTIKSYTLFKSKDLKKLPKSMQNIVKNNDFRLENIPEKLCITNDNLLLNEMPIYKESNIWRNEVHIEEFDTSSNTQKKKKIQASCDLVKVSKKQLFDKERIVIHTQCDWTNNGSTNKFDYFIAQGLGLYKSTHTSIYKKTGSKSVIIVALDKITNI